MKHQCPYTLDYYANILSVFDIGGSLPLLLKSKGLEGDAQRLLDDRNTLEKDYTNAYERVKKDLGRSS